MEINYKNIFISLVCVSAIAGLGYAVYFDHKRRNDSNFRKDLSKSYMTMKSNLMLTLFKRKRKMFKDLLLKKKKKKLTIKWLLKLL